MTIKPFKVLGAAALLGLGAAANAASISLVATSNTTDVVAGDTVTFDIIMDFTTDNNGLGSDATLGGGFDVFFDASALQFVSFVSAGLGDPAFAREPDDCGVVVCDSGAGAGVLESAAFADFNGLSGPALVATVSFTALPTIAGSSAIVGTQETLGIAGPFVSAVDFLTILEVEYNSIEVTGAGAVIPLPAAVWFMLGGLGALAGLRRKAA